MGVTNPVEGCGRIRGLPGNQPQRFFEARGIGHRTAELVGQDRKVGILWRRLDERMVTDIVGKGNHGGDAVLIEFTANRVRTEAAQGPLWLMGSSGFLDSSVDRLGRLDRVLQRRSIAVFVEGSSF